MPTSDPASVDISKSSGVSIIWTDGHRSQYDLQYLRDHCPCALCREKPPAQESSNPLHVYKPRPRLQDAETVGRYAVRFFWNDGHSTGIYSFDHLRAICPCPDCRSQLIH